MDKPIVCDLYCGLGGWSEGFLSEGYECRGYDIEAHDYGTGGYPGQLILGDILKLHGRECRDATVIVGSSPCQKYSYMAMPWTRAKEMAAYYADKAYPERLVELNELFNAQFRIQREASEAAGRYIPLVVENVRGAQKWVGRARWNYGSFYLWGDVPALMPMNRAFKAPGQNWNAFKETGKVSPHWRMQGEKPKSTRLWQDGLKVGNSSAKTFSERRALAAVNPEMDPHNFWHNSREDGVKFSQSGDAWFDGKPRDNMLGEKGPAAYGSRSRSRSRKLASAMVAKIPPPLAQHIARCFLP